MSGVPHRGNRGITCESGTFGTQGDSVPDSVGSLVEVECVSIFSSCAVVTGRLCLCAFESGQRVRWRFLLLGAGTVSRRCLLPELHLIRQSGYLGSFQGVYVDLEMVRMPVQSFY